MPGFFISNCISNGKNFKLVNNCESKLYSDCIDNKDFIIKRTSLDNFRQDKVFYENDEYIIIIEGVVCNATELNQLHGKNNFKDTVIEMVSCDMEFFKNLRGAFSGAVYYKEEAKWVVFTDQLGSHPVYYYYGNKVFIIGSQMNYVTDFMRTIGLKRQESLHGVHCLLDWGYLIDDETIVKDVKRLYPGHYIVIDNENLLIRTYYLANYNEKEDTYESYIQSLDNAFTNAVNRIVNKNIENGYKTAIEISGGLDSRMVAFKLRELGENIDVLAHSFSQYGSYEQKIATEVALRLNFQFIHTILDTDSFIKDIEETMLLNNGASYYIGLQAGKNVSELFDKDVIGIQLSGLMGDMRDSSMLCNNGNDMPNISDGCRFRTSSKYRLNKFSDKSNVISKFNKNEVFWLYTRGILAGMNTVMARQNYVEVMTPFGDVEFLEAYLSIPWEIRVEKRLLLEWMKIKYPEAAKIKYASTYLPAAITESKMQRILTPIIHKIMRVFKGKKFDMTDVDKWMKNKDNSEAVNNYYALNISSINCSEPIRKKLNDLFESGDYQDKYVALSVIAAYKLYLGA